MTSSELGFSQPPGHMSSHLSSYLPLDSGRTALSNTTVLTDLKNHSPSNYYPTCNNPFLSVTHGHQHMMDTTDRGLERPASRDDWVCTGGKNFMSPSVLKVH